MVDGTEKLMKWILTGSEGQLGIAIADELRKSQIPFEEWNRSTLDLSDLKKISKKILESKPTVVINCAAWTNVDSAEVDYDKANLVNSVAVGVLAEAAKSVGAKFVQISSDYVFSGKKLSGYSTLDYPDPINKYGLSKANGEKKVIEIYPKGSYIFRTAWLYGPVGKNFCKSILMKAVTDSNEILVVNDQIGQPTCTTDLAIQIIKTVQFNAAPGIYHSTNSGEASWFQFAQKILFLAKEDVARVVPVASHIFNSPAKRPAYSVLSNEKWSDIGLEPMCDWEMALERIFPTILENVKAGA
jgi:dTDP-4-dehydrorhamnose reductase